MKIEFSKIFIKDKFETLKKIEETIDSGWITQGTKVEEFENVVSRYVLSKYAVAFSSCTSALHIALLLCNVGPGDEVICPSYSFVASANSIVYTGAKPVFADIDLDTYNISADDTKSKITSRTKAILIVHQFGLPCDMDAILKVAREKGLYVIEDAACAIGSEYRGKRIGSIGDLTCFSFHPRKIITTGEGGMLTTENKEWALKAKKLREHGVSIPLTERHKFGGVLNESYDLIGYNYKMTDIQAALGISQMKHIDYIIDQRNKIALTYKELLSDIQNVKPITVPPYVSRYNYQSFSIMLKDNIDREFLLSRLAANGISCRRGIYPIHLFYKQNIYLPNTLCAYNHSLILPMYVGMGLDEQKYVVDNLKAILSEGGS